MDNFSINSCVYDGTSGDPDPICTISGAVNGKQVFPRVFYAYLMAADNADQARCYVGVAMKS